MQFRVLVLLPSDTADIVSVVTALMTPYDTNRKVPRHKELVPQDEIHEVAETFGLAADDLAVVMAELREESGFECWVEDGKIYWMTTDNPQGYWDFWRLSSLQEDVRLVPKIPKDRAPLAIITPDGEWYDLGHQWDTVEDAKIVLWRRAEALLEQYPIYLAVALDCHL